MGLLIVQTLSCAESCGPATRRLGPFAVGSLSWAKPNDSWAVAPLAAPYRPLPASPIRFRWPAAVLSWRVNLNDLEDDLNKSIVFAFAALTLLAGCGPQDSSSGIPVRPKFTGPPYHLTLAAPPAKPNKSGLTIPPVNYAADPNAPSDSLSTRAILVVRIDTSSLKSKGTMTMDQIIMGAVDIPGTEGALPADYMDATDQSVATLLEEYCVKGNVKINVALTRSSLSSTAGDAEIDDKLITPWLPISLVFKNPHAGC
jgi:hypothetical protein